MLVSRGAAVVTANRPLRTLVRQTHERRHPRLHYGGGLCDGPSDLIHAAYSEALPVSGSVVARLGSEQQGRESLDGERLRP